jgi:hypothetical protein
MRGQQLYIYEYLFEHERHFDVFICAHTKADLERNTEITWYVAWPIIFVLVLSRHILSDIYLNCFNTKGEEE